MWLKEEENPTPAPQFEPRVHKLFMLDIAFTTLNPLLFGVLITVLEATDPLPVQTVVNRIVKLVPLPVLLLFFSLEGVRRRGPAHGLFFSLFLSSLGKIFRTDHFDFHGMRK